MLKKIRVVSYGLGFMGQKIIQHLLSIDRFEVVGAIDVNEEIVGKDVGDLLKLEKKFNVVVSNDPDNIISETKPDIVIHTTQSFLKQVYPQLEDIIKKGVNIISTCEELANPCISSPDLANKLDVMAKQENVTILGTGINPGFLMDYLPLILTGPCARVDKIEVIRQINASNRRLPFQKKIGAGLTREEFTQKIKDGSITGHVGLEQSLAMIAAGLNWKLNRIEIEESKPIISEDGVSSEFIKVKAGNASGLTQKARALMDGEEKISLDFRAWLGAPEEFDSITITGIPSFTQKITPCVHGDIGTISIIIKSIPRVIDAPAGLILMKDLPPPISLSVK
ncbi:MAG: NAD(P)H-dependent amine dehydrogenase family protein [Promethearchaeota archaeon]